MINNISFGSSNRIYSRRDANFKNVSCYTSMFREDIQWEKFADYLLSKYKDTKQVNLISAACSDGSEPYSLVISLINADKEKSKKFFSIKAFDIDNQILDCGKNGYIYFNYADIFELKSRGIFRDNEFFSVYDKNTKRKMKANFSPGSELFSVNPILKNKVEFSRLNIIDVLNSLDDNAENTILLFRNAFPYLTENEKLKFLKLCVEKLGKGSMLIMGSFDKGMYGRYFDNYFEQNGFKAIDLFYDCQVFLK